jgi:Zn-dependent protease
MRWSKSVPAPIGVAMHLGGRKVLIGEPVRSQGDLNFRIAGFPVRVTPWFWITSVLLGMGGGSDPQRLLTWVIAAFVSILIHELGHALAFRYYGSGAHIVLYQFGGLAVPDSLTDVYRRQRQRDSVSQIVISAAGPAAQMIVAALFGGVLLLSGYGVPLGGFVGNWLQLPFAPLMEWFPLAMFTVYFLHVSIYWALLNLLPVYPLDGGQIARELFGIFRVDQPIKYSLVLSLIAATSVAVYSFTRDDLYLGLMFGMLAYSSYQALQPYVGGYGRPW